MTETAVALPRYRCHKEVEALKIRNITVQDTDNGTVAILTPEGDYPAFEVSWEFINKHKPEAGMYYVRYTDGYESASPSAAFEGGYSRI